MEAPATLPSRPGGRSRCRKFRLSRGFSLLELLVVLALIVGLAAVSLAAYSSMMRAAALTTGAELVSDALTEARQDAMTQNLTVEVRLYDLPGPGQSASAYRALQLHALKPDGTTPPLRALLNLPTGVAFDTTPLHSSLIAGKTDLPTPDAGDPHLDGQTRAFHFLADGSTDLLPTEAWFLTLRATTQSDPAHFPSDWACVTVDPTTGRIQVFRP